MTLLPRPFAALLLLVLLHAGTSVSRAQSTGFLLGLRYEAPIERPLPYYAGDADSLMQADYYTLFITRNGRSVQVAHRVDDLLIAQRDGFLLAGSKRSVYNDWVEDFVWTAPPGDRPQVPGIQAYNGEHCAGHREQLIHFAGADYLSLELRTAGYCEGAPHPWYFNTLAVVPVDSVDHIGLEVDRVLGDRARRHFEAEANRLMREEADEDVFLPPADLANWGIIRKPGRWSAVGRIDLSDQIAVDDQREIEIAAALPEPLVQRPGRDVPMSRIRSAAPDASDYFISPDGETVVILGKDRLTVHPLEGQVIGRRLIEVALLDGATPVLARWASGKRVEQWLRAMESPRLSARTSSE